MLAACHQCFAHGCWDSQQLNCADLPGLVVVVGVLPLALGASGLALLSLGGITSHSNVTGGLHTPLQTQGGKVNNSRGKGLATNTQPRIDGVLMPAQIANGFQHPGPTARQPASLTIISCRSSGVRRMTERV